MDWTVTELKDIIVIMTDANDFSKFFFDNNTSSWKNQSGDSI